MDKVIDFQAEKFLRQACDYFYFLDNTKLALKCVEIALRHNPKHARAICLKGEILLYGDNVSDAIKYFLEYEKYVPSDYRNLANLATCFEMVCDFESALEYCNSAIENFGESDEFEFLHALYELKISLLVKTGDEVRAFEFLSSLNSILFDEEYRKMVYEYKWLIKKQGKRVLKLVK